MQNVVRVSQSPVFALYRAIGDSNADLRHISALKRQAFLKRSFARTTVSRLVRDTPPVLLFDSVATFDNFAELRFRKIAQLPPLNRTPLHVSAPHRRGPMRGVY